MRALQDGIDSRVTAAQNRLNKSPAWQIKPAIINRIGNIEQVTKPTVMKGNPLPSLVPFSVVPVLTVNPNVTQFLLNSAPIAVRGSFAPTITEAGFTFIATTDSVTIYYDGTNGSTRIKQSRLDGFNETLPAGQRTVTGLTPSDVGAATGPSYDLIAYYSPGSCNISWVEGTAGTPAFCFPAGSETVDDVTSAQIRGREYIGILTITLVPVPTPPPPNAPPPPGTPVGNTGTNGTVTVTVDAPLNGQTIDNNFPLQAHASDSSGKHITGWQAFLDNATSANAAVKATSTNPGPFPTFPGVFISASPGAHTIVIKAFNSAGTAAAVKVPFICTGVDPTGGPTPPPPPPPPPPSPPAPPPPRGCVMLGMVIEPIGPSPWHRENLPQADWVRIYTERGRELIGTPDHPVYTARAGRTEMRDVRKGDMVVCIEGEEKVLEVKKFSRPGVKVCVHMDWGNLFWANGFLSHNKIVLGQF